MIQKYNKKYYDGIVVLVANVYGKTSFLHDKCIDIEAEFFTESEFNQILRSLKACGYTVICYFDENVFIKDYLKKQLVHDFLVFNLARNGYGISKKSLIPTFCDLNSIKYTASNGYVCSFSRQKYHVNLLLKDLGLNCLKSYVYNNNSFLTNPTINSTTKYIIKPLFESASQGISSDSVYTGDSYSDLNSLINRKYTELNRIPLLIQEFISGYEAKTIIINFDKPYPLEPVGVEISGMRNLYNSIITDKISFDYCHSNYLICDELGIDLANEIKKQALIVYQAIGMENYGRIDCRIDFQTKKIYFMDFATMPYFVSGCEMEYVFNQMGQDLKGLLNVIINSALISKYNYSL